MADAVIPNVPVRGQVATIWPSGGLIPLRYFWPFHVDLGTNDDVCDRIRGFDPRQTELFMGMMEVT